jgi:UV DNA damage repair endonuclease
LTIANGQIFNQTKMNNQVKHAFIRKSSSERAQMIGTVRQYVTNDQFLNLLQNIDINDIDVKNKNKPTNIYWICGQLAAFNGIPELCTQVSGC